MHDFLASAQIDNSNADLKSAKLAELKSLIRTDRELDLMVREKFPISHFGRLNEVLRIKGSKVLLDSFHRTNIEKIDITEKLENVEYIGLSDKNEIILNFKNHNLSVAGTYHFTYDFFEDLFRMGKFASFCIDAGYTDLLRYNLQSLFTGKKEVEKQYRLILKNSKLHLRGLTSTKYKNYDNNLALYLSLLGIHKFCKENNLEYFVSKAFLSDSSLNVMLEQNNPVNVEGVGNVYFGISITNSEVRERKFSFELRYRVTEENNSGVTFSGIPDSKDSIFSFNHITGIDNAELKMQNIFKIKEIQNSLLDYIGQLKKSDNLTEDTLNSLTKKIIYSRNFKPQTKKNFKELLDKDVVNRRMRLLQVLCKTSGITADISESTYLERIYHELIVQLMKTRGIA